MSPPYSSSRFPAFPKVHSTHQRSQMAQPGATGDKAGSGRDASVWTAAANSQAPLLLAFNFVTVVGLVIVNKAVFQVASFPFSTAMSLIHYLVTWACLRLLLKMNVFSMPGEHVQRPRYFWHLTVIFGIATPLNNLSLKLNSVGSYQIFKLLVTPLIAIVEWSLQGKAISIARGVILVVLTAACGIATVSDVAFSVPGCLVAMVFLPVSCLYKVYWKACIDEGWQTMPLMMSVFPYASLWVAALIPIVDPPLSEANVTAQGWMLLLGSGVVAFLVNYSGCLVIGLCSPITHQILGQFKTVSTMLFGYLFFLQSYPATTLLGASIAMVAIVLYTDFNLRENRAKLSQAASGSHHSPLLADKA